MKLTKYKLQKGFVVQRYPKKLVLFDSETSTMYTLNDTAAFVFKKMKEGLKKEEIAKQLYNRYNISEKKAQNDVESTIQKLLTIKIFKQA